MKDQILYSAGNTVALQHAVRVLQSNGFSVAKTPGPDVTHLLLDVPNRITYKEILALLNNEITVIGGNLSKAELDGRNGIDLLQDPDYLAENADITAHCAVKIALQRLPVTLKGCHILVIGWGRIGKCLASLLKSMGAQVTVAARKETDRAILAALGYDTINSANMCHKLMRFRVIFNTVPEKVLAKEAATYCHPNCLKIDLASSQGIETEDVIWARGLPNKEAPETSGVLIAKTILRKIQEKE